MSLPRVIGRVARCLSLKFASTAFASGSSVTATSGPVMRFALAAAAIVLLFLRRAAATAAILWFGVVPQCGRSIRSLLVLFKLALYGVELLMQGPVVRQ